MSFTQAQLETAHKHAFRNRGELSRSSLAGCFYCEELYPATDINEWADDDETAICPRCPADTVIGDASGFVLSPEFLQAMNERWFADPSSSEGPKAVIRAFAAAVRRFCARHEREIPAGDVVLRTFAYDLAMIYALSLRLPTVDPDAKGPPGAATPPSRQSVLHPMKVSLEDHLRVIYQDLHGPLSTFDAGDAASIREAVRQWKLNIDNHSGDRITNALRVLHIYLARRMNPRRITAQEVAVIRATLQCANRNLAPTIADELENQLVFENCTCGCPSITIVNHEKDEKTFEIAHGYGTRANGARSYVLLFGSERRVLSLEVYATPSDTEDGSLPLPEAIQPIDEDLVGF